MIRRPFSLALIACVAFATLALAHEEATGVVKERMDLMDSQKDAMKVGTGCERPSIFSRSR